jgi:hypothetical protein
MARGDRNQPLQGCDVLKAEQDNLYFFEPKSLLFYFFRQLLLSHVMLS